MSESPSEERRIVDDPTMQRLVDQIEWYDRHSAYNQHAYKLLKVVVIALAPLIPLVAGLTNLLPWASWVTGVLGVAIAVTESIQHLNQYQANWISFRSTCETLKHEKFLYLAKAGPYAASRDPHALLAERVESFVSQEHAKWASGQEKIRTTTEGALGKGNA
jgi:Protein of unknown function (DUF4231)